MPSLPSRNPATSHALTAAEVLGLPIGTSLLVCTMSDYHIGRKITNKLERRIDRVTPVVFRGWISRPATRHDAGTGLWVVLDQKLRLPMEAMIEIKRGWFRASRYGYEPSVLGLAVAAPTRQRQWLMWNDSTCVIRPEHEQALRREYPRRVQY